MIVQQIFMVTGKVTIDDDVLFCRQLIFAKIPGLGESKLVVIPKKNAPTGAQRVLKIVADTINTGLDGDAEITYNLDGDLTLPLIDTPGIDPKTKAKKGEKGNPDYSHGLIAGLGTNYANPNFNPILSPSGTFPKAQDGGDGSPGGKGGTGNKGQNAPLIEIWVKNITGNGLTVDLRGQEGGEGGKGGKGQFGGNGQKGSPSTIKTDETWLGIPTINCGQPPGRGGNGGRGGDAGCGGDGGDGGNGGILKIFYTQNAQLNLSKLISRHEKGKGGKYGSPGNPGEGGNAGPPGTVTLPGDIAPSLVCKPAANAEKGQKGAKCIDLKTEEPMGTDGNDGGRFERPVTTIPEFPGLWF